MQLNQFRGAAAPHLATTADAILNREKKVRGLMRAAAPEISFGTGHPIEATPVVAAIVVLAVLDAAKIYEATERTDRLWRAHFSRDGKTCPVTGAATAGQALVALIEQPALRRKLDRIDLAHETETITLYWRNGVAPPSLFYPFSAPEWRKRTLAAVSSGPTRTHSLAGTVFGQIAGLIAKHTAG